MSAEVHFDSVITSESDSESVHEDAKAEETSSTVDFADLDPEAEVMFSINAYSCHLITHECSVTGFQPLADEEN